jgi:uncharacterized damage-inducible protein DinB
LEMSQDRPSPLSGIHSQASVEPWLRGPLPNVSWIGMPAAHAFLQCQHDLRRWTSFLSEDQFWLQAPPLASVAFQVRHIAGSLDRLLTYANGNSLSDHQLSELKAESTRSESLAYWVTLADQQIQRAIDRIADTKDSEWAEPRTVGRRQLPTNTIGLLFHAAEHTQRHVGQLIVTVRVVVGNDFQLGQE